jgi:hypothetical protein
MLRRENTKIVLTQEDGNNFNKIQVIKEIEETLKEELDENNGKFIEKIILEKINFEKDERIGLVNKNDNVNIN